MDNDESGNAKANNPIPTMNEKTYYSPAKIGLFVGIISFFVVSFLSFGGSCCVGIFLSIGIGAIAGWLTARYSNIGIWDSASEFGGRSGRIAGVFILLGHIVGGILPSLLFRMGEVLGVFPGNDVAFTELNSGLIRQGTINGIIGLIVSWVSASVIASKVYEKDQIKKHGNSYIRKNTG